jgi:hypothetical protein
MDRNTAHKAPTRWISLLGALTASTALLMYGERAPAEASPTFCTPCGGEVCALGQGQFADGGPDGFPDMCRPNPAPCRPQPDPRPACYVPTM